MKNRRSFITGLKFIGIDAIDKSSYQVNKVSLHTNTYKYWKKLIENLLHNLNM